MTKTTLTREKLVAFLTDLSFDEKEGKDFFVLTGKEAREQDKPYVGEDALFYLSFDGSSLYDAFNHYDEAPFTYNRDNKFYEFCKKHNVYHELGYGWCGTINPN